jgi:hemerythrin
MPWDKRLSVAHASIDSQHRILVDLLDQVQASSDGDFETSVSVVLDLAKYVVTHFDYEQMLMERYAYPGREAHQREHASLIAQVKGFLDQLRSGELSRQQLHVLLTDWVRIHICDEDMRLGEFLAGRD